MRLFLCKNIKCHIFSCKSTNFHYNTATMKAQNKLAEILFPKTCVLCGTTGEYLCANCKKLLQPHPEICPYCHRPSEDYRTCFTCKLTNKPNLEGLIVPFAYTPELKQLIFQLKYKHQKDVAQFLSDRMVLAIQAHQKLSSIIDQYREQGRPERLIISYIPSHWYRKRFTKWYNQAEILARGIHDSLYLPILEILQKPYKTKNQVSLKRQDRLINLQWKFRKNPKITLYGNETILIVDDVTTTWATLEEAARTIKEIYPNTKIRGIVLARHI